MRTEKYNINHLLHSYPFEMRHHIFAEMVHRIILLHFMFLSGSISLILSLKNNNLGSKVEDLF